MTYLRFESHALPVLLEMSEGAVDHGEPFPLISRLIARGLTEWQASDLASKLLDDGYLSMTYEPRRMADGRLLIHDPSITPKALKMLALWPEDNEQALFIVRRLAEHLEQIASTTSDSTTALSARSAAGWLRDVSVDVAAAMVTKATGLSS